MNTHNAPVREEDLQAWVDGCLGDDKCRKVEAWLREHPKEADRWHNYRIQADALRKAYAPIADEPVPAALSAVLDDRRPLRSVRAGKVLQVAAAVLIFVVGAVTGGYWQNIEDQGAARQVAWTQPALAAHRTYAVEVRHPVEVGADEQSHLLAWLSKRMQRPMKAPDLTALGFKLLGGRLLPGDTLPSCQLMYEDGAGRRVTLYLTSDANNQDTAFRLVERDGLTAFYWVDRKLGYALVGQVDRAEMEQAAHLVHDAFSQNGVSG